MSDNLTSNSALFWEARDFGPAWEGIVINSDTDEEFIKYRIDVDDDAKFQVWVGRKKDPGCYREVKTGPLSKRFDCVCQAQRACEAHHAR